MAKQDSEFLEQKRLEEFLKVYEKARGEGSAHYADYIKTYGKDAGRLYTEAVKDTEVAFDRAQGGYGKRAEWLASQGGAAGYAKYLSDRTNKKRIAGLRTAREGYDTATRQNKAGYAAYLESATNRLRNVINSMRSQGINVKEDAYAYALTAGIDQENALVAADLVSGMEETAPSFKELEIRAQVMVSIINNFLPRDAAYEYARACGLSSKTAADIAASAEEIMKRNDYLKN